MSLCTAKDYQHRKAARNEMKVEPLKDDNSLLKTARELSEDREKQRSKEKAQLNAAKEKTDQLLKIRTKTFTNWQQKMEKETRRCKQAANQ